MDEKTRSELDKIFSQRRTLEQERAAAETAVEQKRKAALQTIQELRDRVIRPELQAITKYLKDQSYPCQLVEWPKDRDSRVSAGIALVLEKEHIIDGETWHQNRHISFREMDIDSIIVDEAAHNGSDQHHVVPKDAVTPESVRAHVMTVLKQVLPP